MSRDEEIVLKKPIRKSSSHEKALQKLDCNVLERLRKATELENPYKIKVNRKKELDREKYEKSLEEIICQDYYPDLSYMNKNKNDYDNINTIINNPPGTLNMNDFDTLQSFNINKKLPNITEFQSKYTHKGHLSLLALTNQDQVEKREKESWIEQQSFHHNIKREMNIIQMNQKSSIQNTQFDEKSLILNKSQSRSNFMFPNYSHNYPKNDQILPHPAPEKLINPRNTRYNYMDDFQNDERLVILKQLQSNEKKRLNNSHQTSGFRFPGYKKAPTNSLVNSPLVKNALRRSQNSGILVDHQLRDSYSYQGKTKQSLSRLT